MTQRVSLCMIVKDEEANLAACLDPVIDLVHEVIVVDTGSTDRTREVARNLGARVFDFPWADSFAAARNESLRHAGGDWVFWMDADDRLDNANRAKLQALFQSLPEDNGCFTMRCQGTPDAGTLTGMVVNQQRLFRRHPDVCWQYRVHEQVWPSIARIGGVNRWSDVIVHHLGYKDPALRGRKRERNLRLLHLEETERPDDPYILFNLGAVYQEKGQLERAVALLQRSLELAPPGVAYAPLIYLLLIRCQRSQGQMNAALATCLAGRQRFPGDAGLLFEEASIRGAQGDEVGEETCLLRLLSYRPESSLGICDLGLWAYQARHNLAVIYRDQGRLAQAEAQWRAAVAATPNFTLGWRGLAELYLSQQCWAELEQVVRTLEAGLIPSEEAALLRARAHLARREFGAARQLLEGTIAHHPNALDPRKLYSMVLLQEGRDWNAAEQALRAVLALDPQQEVANKNLALLLQRRDCTKPH